MSGTLASPEGPPDRAPNRAALAARSRKPGCGCFGSISGLIVLAVGLLVLLNPWSLRMGGRWTPALTWHGVGKLHSTSGAAYGLFMELSPYLGQYRRGSSRSHKNLEGSAKICTPGGEVYAMTVDGYLKQAWFDADGKPITFYLRSPGDAQPRLRADFYGSWQGQDLLLDDKGSMAMSFAADGNAKGYLKGTNAPAEDTTGSLHYAAESEFASLCGGKAKSSF